MVSNGFLEYNMNVYMNLTLNELKVSQLTENEQESKFTFSWLSRNELLT